MGMDKSRNHHENYRTNHMKCIECILNEFYKECDWMHWKHYNKNNKERKRMPKEERKNKDIGKIFQTIIANSIFLAVSHSSLFWQDNFRVWHLKGNTIGHNLSTAVDNTAKQRASGRKK